LRYKFGTESHFLETVLYFFLASSQIHYPFNNSIMSRRVTPVLLRILQRNDRGLQSSSNQSFVYFSSDSSWNKKQIEKIEKRFTEEESSKNVDSDEDLQQMWKEMESRVTKRRPRTLRDTKGKTGRENIKKTDEEMWLQEGLYPDKENSDSK